MIFEDWGLIQYEEALSKQLEKVEELQNNPDHPGYLIFCSHPAVVTTGRQTEASDIFNWKGPVIEISRGGRATYHGPSQIVVYPIMNLKPAKKHRGPQEIRGYLRDFEQAIVKTLESYGVQASGKKDDDTGVWIKTFTGPRKIASLGIAVKKWITFHGAAINVSYDPEAFQGINPCGFNTDTMISLEQILDQEIDVPKFKDTLRKELETIL